MIQVNAATIKAAYIDGTPPDLLSQNNFHGFFLGKIDAGQLITHRFALNDILKAYEVFGNAAQEKAMKVILTQ